MIEPKIIYISKLSEARAYYGCCVCSKHFIGYVKDSRFGKNKYCSNACKGIGQKNNGHLRQRYKALRSEVSRRIITKQALIIEAHVNNPNRSLRGLEIDLNINYGSINIAVKKYYPVKGDAVISLKSDLDSERAIELSKMYNI